jgi:hypothetical protein
VATISEQRAAIAAAISPAAGMSVRTERPGIARAGDGWVNLTRVAPSAFANTTCDATFTVVLVLGADERRAVELAATLSVPVINAVTTGALHPDGVAIETAVIPAGDSAPGDLYALILTLTLEVA